MHMTIILRLAQANWIYHGYTLWDFKFSKSTWSRIYLWKKIQGDADVLKSGWGQNGATLRTQLL